MWVTDEFLKVVRDDREREIQERLRVRRLIGPRHRAIRWRAGRGSLVERPNSDR
jgi:hypothetical protein